MQETETKLHIAFVIDQRNGLMFNNRRVSMDSVLREEVLGLARAASGCVRVRPYSLTQFGKEELVQASDAPWCDAKDGDVVFVEDVDPATISGVSKVTLFHWNRRYPFDLVSTFDFADFELVQTKEFAGTSHERITEETWVRMR